MAMAINDDLIERINGLPVRKAVRAVIENLDGRPSDAVIAFLDALEDGKLNVRSGYVEAVSIGLPKLRIVQMERDVKMTERHGTGRLAADDLPLVGRLILGVIEKQRPGKAYRISEAQLERLKRPVVNKLGDFPSPFDESEMYPPEWQDFMNHIHEMPVWKHKDMTVGGLIDAVCNYHWLGGWLKYRPGTQRASEPVNTFSDLFGDD